MKTILRWAFAASLVPLAACADQPKPPAAPPAPAPLAEADAQFVQTLSEANLLEIALAKVAATNAGQQKVKDYASMLNDDHTGNEAKLREIASAHGLTLADTLNDDDQKIVTTMQGEKGRRFDRDYTHAMIEGHTQLLPKVQAEMQSTTDDTLKSYATDTAAAVQKHIDGAKALAPAHGGTAHHRHHH
ncbi:hypothetical protein AA103196_2793 [Ameyamaea chiangmaiensis NBRC 103196]|uniref:DUF4142 domain-containing protein n=1 Tax=Ameyamaea chiangmaiensis TaxID=442969 RepID=A0A850P9U9_9PROT|nr:DUF4142 domain-containing protein [Ameyamaea chiangmaiensis]MBS4074284.1 DUF4142 domain-containing protein [Ameyamaea chiangmaiensis]NVN40698.1 DUF4142 domain-containing protein [Ameyamaea chiangmaiensis]GBQ71502.1 hypothetical protein AA103196_2793 [Ameyamaea chiangmaiensis NBRC 103196]